MKIEEAVLLLQEEYEHNKTLDHVKDPVAFSLYRVWKRADSDRKKVKKVKKNER